MQPRHFLGIAFFALAMKVACLDLSNTQANHKAHILPTETLNATNVIDLAHNLVKDAPQNRAKHTQEQLNCYMRNLKSFISENHLDTFRFEVMAQRLDDDLSCIFGQAELSIFGNGELSRQFSVSSRMFAAMVFATHILGYYDDVHKPHHFLLNRVVDLNVRLWLLVDSHGALNTHLFGYVQKLRTFGKNVEYWKQSFVDLTDVPNEVHQLFDEQVFQAEETIRDLWHQVPGWVLETISTTGIERAQKAPLVEGSTTS
ncbi:hypothetical protein JCM33374_g4511 [Metschnikowia sp. JCM 33374]|nr:hypothetical protein JCM33374_g4511 [Metschnikowia sp. JCM 33374]